MASLNAASCVTSSQVLPYRNWFVIESISCPSIPGFHLRCGLSGCQKEFRNLLTYRNHIYAFHTDSHASEPSQTNSDGGSSDLDDGELDQPLNLQPSEPTPLDPSELKKAGALGF